MRGRVEQIFRLTPAELPCDQTPDTMTPNEPSIHVMTLWNCRPTRSYRVWCERSLTTQTTSVLFRQCLVVWGVFLSRLVLVTKPLHTLIFRPLSSASTARWKEHNFFPAHLPITGCAHWGLTNVCGTYPEFVPSQGWHSLHLKWRLSHPTLLSMLINKLHSKTYI